MNNFKEYIKKCIKELKKVNWPNKPKVVETTLIVSGCTLVFAAFLWLVDILINGMFTLLY